MPEAEDVIVDAARHASSYAIALWQRNRVRRPGPEVLVLADVRRRLELFVEAVLGVQVPVRTAQPAAPRTLLSRLIERGKRRRSPTPVPATDGLAIYLPPTMQGDAASALHLYRAAAIQQAARVVRSTAACYPWSESLLVQDLFLLSETEAIECELTASFPGLAGLFAEVRHAAARKRSWTQAPGSCLECVERMYRHHLECAALDRAHCAKPAASLEWARFAAARLPGTERYPGLEADVLLGAIVRPDAAPAASASHAEPSAAQVRELQASKLARRPRVRAAAEDEDDSGDNAPWMIQTTQPHEHAEDAMGLQRPVDKEPDADLQGAGESISELESLRLVSTPGAPREAFVADDELALRGARAEDRREILPGALAYPEWDYMRAGYIERAAIVRTVATSPGSAQWVDRITARHRATLNRVRRRFEALRSRRSVHFGEPEGEDVDLQAFVHAFADRRARLPRSDRLYVDHRPARRDFALLLLADTSGSTEAWCGGTHRIIDLEKEALLVVATALQALNVRFAIQSFSGYGPSNVRVGELKRFEEPFDRHAACRIAAMEPDEFTRVGAALRHATATIRREPAYRRLVLLLSDGKPNDCDRYEGRYGFEDTRQALAEARLQGIAPFCVTVDHQASSHLAALFGPGNYSVVNAPQQLTGALLEWLRAVTIALA